MKGRLAISELSGVVFRRCGRLGDGGGQRVEDLHMLNLTAEVLEDVANRGVDAHPGVDAVLARGAV